MTEENKDFEDTRPLNTYSTDLAADVADYLQAGEDQKQQKWRELISVYRFEKAGSNRYILKDGNAELSVSIEHGRDDLDLIGRASDYMKKEKFNEKMDLFVDLKNDFNHEWKDQELELRSPTTGEIVNIAVPSLKEFYRGLKDEEIDEEEREVYKEMMAENYDVTGTADKQFYSDGNDWLVDSEEIGDEGLHLLEDPGEKTSIDDMLELYEAIRGEGFKAARGFLESTRETFPTAEVDDYEVFVDSHNDKVGVIDKSNFDIYSLSTEEIDQMFQDQVSDRINMIVEMYS